MPEAQDGARRPLTPLAVTGLLLVVLSLLWIGGVQRPLGLVLFAEQPMAALLGLAAVGGWLMLATRGRQWPRPLRLGLALPITAATALFFAWLAWRYPEISMQAMRRPDWMTALCGLCLAGLLILIWRLVGLAICVILLAFAALALFDLRLGIPTTAGDRLALYLVTDASGLLNLPLRVALEIVLPFVFFGKLLELSGGSAWFTDLSQTAFGRYRGGAAKVSVAASALFGSVSGNAVSNVVGTGVITIPLMKRSGFKAQTAGAIEAVASTGGQLLPPVMGAAAFVMADLLRVPYAAILLAALVPALLYFAAVFIQVDGLAARDGIHGMPPAPGVTPGRVLLAGGHFLLPFLVLFVAFLAFAARPQLAALYAIGSVVVVSALFGYKGQRSGPRLILKAAAEAGVASIPVILVTAAAGLLIGLINITGLSFSIAEAALAISGGSPGLLLVVVALAAIVLGMGMPTVAVYILLATLLAPALEKAGFGGIQAHLFILYFGMMSMITPPIALAAITAANLAGADQWRTSWRALGLAWVAYVVPFLFMYSPSLTLEGPWPLVTATFASALAGIYAVSAALLGYRGERLSPGLRLAWLAAGVALFLPPGFGDWAVAANLAGAVLFGGLLFAGHRIAALPRR